MKWNYAALAVIMVAFAFVQVAASDWEQRAASEEGLALQPGRQRDGLHQLPVPAHTDSYARSGCSDADTGARC